MKKILLLSAVISALLLCGCTGTAEPVSEPSPIPSSVETPSPAPEPTPEPTPVPTERPLLDPVLTEQFIDASMFSPANEQGSVVMIEYDTQDYYGGSGEIYHKQAAVYLPYGYDGSEEYNLLIMMHVMGCNEYYWLSSGHSYTTESGECMEAMVPVLLDNMIEKGMCRPLIVVAPSGYITEEARYEHNSERDFQQFAQEYRNDLLPCIYERFSVAQGRDSCAYYGSSFGAYMGYRSIMGQNFDNTGWFVLTGGGQLEPEWLIEKWQLSGTDGLPLRCLLLTEGEYDDRGPVELGYYAMSSNFENVYYNMILETGHNENEWIAALYNALQLFFR